MDRRFLLLSLAAASSAGPALAQATAPSGSGMSTPPMAVTGAGMGAGAMGQAERDHAMQTAMVGTASLMMADIALEKAEHAKVKEFAKFEHDEQTTVAEILKSMDPNMAPPQPDAATMDAINKLKAMKSGKAFDHAFLMGQTDGHQKLLVIQEDYLKAGKDRETVNTTKLVRGMVKEHLTLLSDLTKMYG